MLFKSLILKILLIMIFIIALFITITVKVPKGYRYLVVKKNINNCYVLNSGWHFINPFFTKVVPYYLGDKTCSTTCDIVTKDNTRLTIHFYIDYEIPEEFLISTYNKYNTLYLGDKITEYVQECSLYVFSFYTEAEVGKYSNEIEALMVEELFNKTQEINIIVTNVLITEI